MPLLKRATIPLAALLLHTFAFSVAKADVQSEQILNRALSVASGSKVRQVDRGEAIRALASQGLVSLAPDFRADYTDYQLVSGELRFLDYPVVLITEAYFIEWVGCCPNEGIGLTIKGPVNEGRLQSFARTNSCEVGLDTWITQVFATLDQRAEYWTLFCPDEF